MDRTVKRGLIFITYAIVLYLILSHLSTVSQALTTLTTVLGPVLLGIVIAYILNLLMRPMETKWLRRLWLKCPRLARGKRAICIVLSLVLVLALITGLCLFVIPQVGASIANLANSVPGYVIRVSQYCSGLESQLDMDNQIVKYLWDTGNDILQQSGTWIKNIAGGMTTWLLNTVASISSGLVNTLIGLIFAIYILADKEHLSSIFDRLMRAILKDSVRERTVYIVHKADHAFGGFITGQLIEACILGALCFIGLTIIGFFVGGMPYALLISVLVGFCNIIPILGAYMSAIPSTLLILIVSPIKALIFIIFLVVVQQFEGNVIYPKVVGTSIGIGGMWVLLALTIGGKLMGLSGMVLGIPAFAVIYALVREFTEQRIRQKREEGQVSFDDVNSSPDSAPDASEDAASPKL